MKIFWKESRIFELITNIGQDYILKFVLITPIVLKYSTLIILTEIERQRIKSWFNSYRYLKKKKKVWRSTSVCGGTKNLLWVILTCAYDTSPSGIKFNFVTVPTNFTFTKYLFL